MSSTTITVINQSIRNIKPVRSFTRTLDQSALRSLDQICADLLTIYSNWMSPSFCSGILMSIVKPIIDELIWNEEDEKSSSEKIASTAAIGKEEETSDDNLIQSSKLELIEIISDRLRCLRSEIVSHNWISSHHHHLPIKSAEVDQQRERKSQLNSVTVCWFMSSLICLEESVLYLESHVINIAKKKHVAENVVKNIPVKLKRSLVVLFVDAQTALNVLVDFAVLIGDAKLNHLFSKLSHLLSLATSKYYQQQLVPNSTLTQQLNEERVSSMKKVRDFDQSKNKIKCKSEKMVAVIDETSEKFIAKYKLHLSRLLLANKISQLTFTSEMGCPLVFRPPPDDEKIARESMWKMF